MKNLFVEFLNTNNRERQKEYDDTLSINNQLNYFDNIYIIKGKDVVLPFQSDKFKIIPDDIFVAEVIYTPRLPVGPNGPTFPVSPVFPVAPIGPLGPFGPLIT